MDRIAGCSIGRKFHGIPLADPHPERLPADLVGEPHVIAGEVGGSLLDATESSTCRQM
jgi:hypothetical protein